MLPHYPEKLECSNLLHFYIYSCVPIEGSYQTHGGTFITSQPIIKISWTILWVCSVCSWFRTRSLSSSTFSSVRPVALRGLPLPQSVDCAGVSELFQQPVNADFRPSFVCTVICLLRRFISLQLIKIVYQNLILVTENYVCKHCGDVCNDVILMS